MDGIDEPPLCKKFIADAQVQHVPRRAVRRPAAASARCACVKPPQPRKEQIYFIGACNVPLERSTRRSPARAAWAATSTSARPRGRTGATSSTSTWRKVAHEEALDTPKARDELARITTGYSPAMIDQVCSLALTYAHSDGRPVFSRRTSSRR